MGTEETVGQLLVLDDHDLDAGVGTACVGLGEGTHRSGTVLGPEADGSPGPEHSAPAPG